MIAEVLVTGDEWGGCCTDVQRAQPVEKAVDHMWGREVNG
jgi:hypothetical protein